MVVLARNNKTVLETSKQADEFANYAFHQGSHPRYTALIEENLSQIERNLSKNLITELEATNQVLQLISNTKNAIKNGKGVSINDLLFN